MESVSNIGAYNTKIQTNTGINTTQEDDYNKSIINSNLNNTNLNGCKDQSYDNQQAILEEYNLTTCKDPGMEVVKQSGIYVEFREPDEITTDKEGNTIKKYINEDGSYTLVKSKKMDFIDVLKGIFTGFDGNSKIIEEYDSQGQIQKRSELSTDGKHEKTSVFDEDGNVEYEAIIEKEFDETAYYVGQKPKYNVTIKARLKDGNYMEIPV